MNKNAVALILTAGKGKRMRSKLIKNLHPLAGKPMINHLVDTVKETGFSDIAFVIGNDAEKVKTHLGDDYTYIYQNEILGTGHAVMQAEEYIKNNLDSTIVVFLGDGPLISVQSLQEMICKHQKHNAAATLMTAIVENPYGYGRIIRSEDQSVKYTVEEKDANEVEKLVKEVWAGICCYRAKDLLESLANIDNTNAQGEYYLPDTFKHLVNKGNKVMAVTTRTREEFLTVNNRSELAAAEAYLNYKTLRGLMDSGVTIVSPETTVIEANVKIEPDTTILPFTYLTGNSTIGTDCIIGPYTHLNDSIVLKNVKIERSTVRASKIDDNAIVGPFAYIRPGTHVQDGSKVGQFVEVKNSTIGKGSKVPHLSYVGDADIGDKVNLGAGTIVVNYDGHTHYRTVIEDSAFIGCNSNLVSPIKIGKGAYVAAGSTVTKDVPTNALAIARSKQVNKDNWALRRRKLKESTIKEKK